MIIWLLAVLLFQMTPRATIRCDVDGQLAYLAGSVQMSDGHLICDRHIIFTAQGELRCPLDGSEGKKR